MLMKTLAFAVGMTAVSIAASAALDALRELTSIQSGLAAFAHPAAIEAPDADAKLCALRQRALALAGGATAQAADTNLAAAADEAARPMAGCEAPAQVWQPISE